jgi:hypothetical protein
MYENNPQEPQPPFGQHSQGYQPPQQEPYRGFYAPQFGQQQGWEQQPRRGRPPGPPHLAGAEFTVKGLTGDDQDDANNCAAAIGANQQTYQSGFEGLAAGTNFDGGQFNTSPGSSSIGWVSFEVSDGSRWPASSGARRAG